MVRALIAQSIRAALPPVAQTTQVFRKWSPSWIFFLTVLIIRIVVSLSVFVLGIVAFIDPVFSNELIKTSNLEVHGYIALAAFTLTMVANIITNTLLTVRRSVQAYEREMTASVVSCGFGSLAASYLIVPTELSSLFLCKVNYDSIFWHETADRGCQVHALLTASTVTAVLSSTLNFMVMCHSHYKFFRVYGGFTATKHLLCVAMFATTVAIHVGMDAIDSSVFRPEYQRQHSLLRDLILVNGYIYSISGVISSCIAIWAIVWRSKILLFVHFLATFTAYCLQLTAAAPLVFWCRELMSFFCDLSKDKLTIVGETSFEERQAASHTCELRSILMANGILSLLGLVIFFAMWLVAFAGLIFWHPTEWLIVKGKLKRKKGRKHA